MGIEDKLDAVKDKAMGKAKEAVGKVRDDDSQVVEGKLEHAKGVAKDKLADTKAHLKEDISDVHTDDTEGGARPL